VQRVDVEGPTVTFHMPDSWYEPPAEHDCPDDPEPCECEDRADAAREQHDVDRADAERDDAR
jgi:hypothetical protein